MTNKQTIYNLHLDNGVVLEVRSSKTKQEIENDNLNIEFKVSGLRAYNGMVHITKCIKVNKVSNCSLATPGNMLDFLR